MSGFLALALVACLASLVASTLVTVMSAWDRRRGGDQ